MPVHTVEQAEKIRTRDSKILYIGDMLISYGDFLENNAQLLPASYVEEAWAQQLKSMLPSIPIDSSDNGCSINRDRLIQLAENPLIVPTIEEAFEICNLGMPLHPKYSFYWDTIAIDDLLYLKDRLVAADNNNSSMPIDARLKDILERLGVTHSVANGRILLDDKIQAFSLKRLLSGPAVEAKDSIEFVTKSSGIKVMPKFASTIAVRVGRPEKASERKMKPPVHALFPIGSKGGATRDILKAAREGSFYTEIANRYCDSCKLPSVGTHCRACGASTMIRNLCIVCRGQVEEGEKCGRCGKEGRTYSSVNYPLKDALDNAKKKLGVTPEEPFKGVKSLMSRHRSAE